MVHAAEVAETIARRHALAIVMDAMDAPEHARDHVILVVDPSVRDFVETHARPIAQPDVATNVQASVSRDAKQVALVAVPAVVERVDIIVVHALVHVLLHVIIIARSCVRIDALVVREHVSMHVDLHAQVIAETIVCLTATEIALVQLQNLVDG